MSWKLLVKSSAESDILDGFVDFEERLDGLGKRFLDEVGIRRSITHIFPHLVFYTIEKETIFILAVIHAAQDPKYIASRLIA
jgi:plasmid stabilization system protein ParE